MKDWDWHQHLTRRRALKVLGAGALALTIPGCSSSRTLKPESRGGDAPSPELLPPDFRTISPVDRSLAEIKARAFSGDNPDQTHAILWNKEGYLTAHGGSVPAPAERVPLVVVGGGMSGLSTAYLLREHQPVVLERAERFGGNAKGESWNGLDYSIGAAYFMTPPKGSEIERFHHELGLDRQWRVRSKEDPVVFKGRRYSDFWKGATAPAHKKQFEKLSRHFEDVGLEHNGARFPEIPALTPEMRAIVNELDKITFHKHLQKVAGGKLHPHIEGAIEHFCWSSYGASSTEIGAASGLNFYAGEAASPLVVTPGGNSGVSERILARLSTAVPRSNLRTGCIVFDVQVVADGVIVAYEDPKGDVRSIHARSVVMACPKFAVKKILRDIEPDRLAAIQRLRYNAYLVANVLLKAPVKDDFYDLFFAGDGKTDLKNFAGAAMKQKVTDVVYGNYAKVDPSRAILTLYRALPFTGGRPLILAPSVYDQYRGEFEQQLHGSLLGLVGANREDVVDVRISRWGHPLPVAAAGLIADGVVDKISAPFRERVFFVEQDNWALPALETAVTEALRWSPVIAKSLGS